MVGDGFEIDKVDVLRNCVVLLPECLDRSVSIDGFILDLRLISPDLSL